MEQFDEAPPTIASLAAAPDFHSAPRRGRLDLEPRSTPIRQKHAQQPDDEVILSDVANVSMLAAEGLTANAIAAGLSLTAEEVITDLNIAVEICGSKL